MIEMIPQEPYKRRAGDSAKCCPYCGKAMVMNYDRYKAQHSVAKFDLAPTICTGCGRMFYFVNVTKQWVRETGIPATYRKEFVKGIR